ncbi:MAG: TAXI family TRAP transporter solute-binding subunit [Sphaerochaetaceae bacterium]|nr:TAXI family TRAP transporter solute-binding subunit [Sphaerochaetaceae bacterium]
MKKVRTGVFVLVLMLISSLVFAAAQAETGATGSADTLQPATYSWTAGGMGGGWYTQAGGMAAIVKNNVPEITIKVIPGGGTVNPPKLDAGQDDFGWGVGYVDKAAYNGTAPLFDKAYTNFRGLAGNFSVDFYHFLAAKNTGITTIDELVAKIKAGEKVNLAGPMPGTSERTLTTLLFENYYGISYEQIEKNGGRVIYAAYGDMVNLYKDRHVDYVIACLGLPGSAITEMAISRDSVLLKASDELVKFSDSTYGTVSFDSGLNRIPGGTYSGIANDIQAIGHSTEVTATAGLPDLVAYNFVKTLMENIDEVQSLNPSFKKYFSKENAPNTMVPLHPGAERYYREAGLIQ